MVAVGILRTRPVPFATVGNTIDFAYTPSSFRRLLNSCVNTSSPMIQGVIGVHFPQC